VSTIDNDVMLSFFYDRLLMDDMITFNATERVFIVWLVSSTPWKERSSIN
jgi:hypothetical protein